RSCDGRTGGRARDRAARREPAASRVRRPARPRRLRDRCSRRRACTARSRGASARAHRRVRRRRPQSQRLGPGLRALLRGPPGRRAPVRARAVTFWSFTAYLLLPYALWNLLWRGVRYRPYWNRWPERFGFVRSAGRQRIIWVHAVSVGEVRSSAPLVAALDQRY